MAMPEIMTAREPVDVAVEDEAVQMATDATGPLADEDVQRIVSAALTDAIQYTDEVLSPARALATDAYFARPYGDEEDGRSKVVSTDVRDAIGSVLPSLLRVIFGPERVVEYVPSTAAAAEAAQQETDFIFHVFEEEQQGFLQTHAVLKDGLTKGLGIVKYWWEHEPARTDRLENVSLPQRMALEQEPGVEVLEAVERPRPRRRLTTRVGQAMGLRAPDLPTYDITVKRVDVEGHLRIEAVPPEEFVFSRQARGLDRALCIAHRTEKTRGELIAMGIDEAIIDEWGGPDALLTDNPEDVARRDGQVGDDPEAGEANAPIFYAEAYVPLDVDGDGVAELRLARVIGPALHVIDTEAADEPNFCIFCPDPEPHVIAGLSWADRTQDIQNINSHVLRAILDSAGFSIFPRLGVVNNRVNMADVLNTEIGAPIRMDAPGMVMPLDVPFIGQQMFTILSYLENVIERRTGRNKAAAGLDADALQSTTKEGVTAAVQGSAEQVELLARIFCEMTLKPLFRGLRRLYLQHQPRARTVRLRGQYVDVDPRTWDADAQVTVNVALGSTMTAGRAQALMAIYGIQKEIVSTLGLGQPLVNPQQLAHTLRRLTETLGFKDAERFFSAVPTDWQPPAKPPEKSPEQTLAEAQLAIEQMKTQRELAIKEAELELKRETTREDRVTEMVELAVESALKRLQINAQFGATTTQQQLNAAAAEQDRMLEAVKIGHEREEAAHRAAMDTATAEREQAQAAPPTETSRE